jgi:hypothetical protein
MITIDQFTDEIKAKIPDYIDHALDGVFDGKNHKNFDRESALGIVNKLYDMAEKPRPKHLIVVENPLEAKIIYHYLVANENMIATAAEGIDRLSEKDIAKFVEDNRGKMKFVESSLFAIGIYARYYYTWYKFIQDEFKIETTGAAAELNTLEALNWKANIYSAIFCEEVCIVSKYPTKIVRNAANLLHNPAYQAVTWASTFPCTAWDDCYYINGRHIPAEIFNKAKTLTREEFVKERNSDYKGAWYEILGQKGVMALLGAKEIDKQTLVHSNGDLEEITLLKTEDTFEEIDNQPFAWVKMVCPSTGTQYLQGVEPHHTDARSAIASLSRLNAEDYSWDMRS